MRLPYLLLPLLLIFFGPLDLIVGILHNSYPTEATIISITSFVIGIVLLRFNLNKYGAETSLTNPVSELEYDLDVENEALAEATSRLNTRLGTGLLLFGVALNLLFIINGFIGPTTRPNNSSGNIVETAFIVFFNLMVALLEIFAARIYTTGRR